uniref:Uncharacterized protein n=1 Tax=Nelumbo nucifera TaxID=4432 RepID=A0A822YEJ6_NELNU|nr:TPA_asm: hypothetical protein HUJ06_030853 [Nelumbo nucifera]
MKVGWAPPYGLDPHPTEQSIKRFFVGHSQLYNDDLCFILQPSCNIAKYYVPEVKSWRD